jgi:hypothetical protein
MKRKTKLLIWEIGCIFWIVFAGALLHFAFELSEYWKPMALIAAVNESVWEHLKMYFWPGLAFALVQYTYARDYANNYWLAKVAALIVTPALIIICYEAYIGYAAAAGVQPSLAAMLGIMFAGIIAGQMTSFFILAAEPMSEQVRRIAPVGYAAIVGSFSLFTFFPPQVSLFENYACYTYTGEYGILDDYEPYRIFTRVDENGEMEEGLGMNYCASIKADAIKKLARQAG